MSDMFGKSWSSVGVFDDFEGANDLRNQILQNQKNLDCKVHRQERGFVVKTRSKNLVEPVAEVQPSESVEDKKVRTEKPKQASRAAAKKKNKY